MIQIKTNREGRVELVFRHGYVPKPKVVLGPRILDLTPEEATEFGEKLAAVGRDLQLKQLLTKAREATLAQLGESNHE